MDHLFMGYELVQYIWTTILECSPNRINANLHFFDWIDHISTNDKACRATFENPLEKIFVISWISGYPETISYLGTNYLSDSDY